MWNVLLFILDKSVNWWIQQISPAAEKLLPPAGLRVAAPGGRGHVYLV